MDSIKELLLKLKQLSEKGEGGEKENASEMLRRLMAKHNISEDDLQSIDISQRVIMLPDLEENTLRLTKQIISSVLGKGHSLYSYVKNNTKLRKRTRFVDCTASEQIELQCKIDFYAKEYKRKENIFYSGFVQVNALYAKPTGDEENRELTERDMEVLRMSNAVGKSTFMKRIGK